MARRAVRKTSKPAKKTMRAGAAKTVRKAAGRAVKKAVKKALKQAARKPARKAAAPGPRKLRDGRAPDSPQLIPALTVRNMQDSIDFYREAFGFKLEFTVPGPDGSAHHAQMTYFGARIMFSPEGAYGGTVRAPATTGHEQPVQSYVYCPDIDAFTARARAGGARVLMEPVEMFWGDRMAHLEDLNGYRWAFATNLRAFDPRKAQDPRNG